jgi:hypothetical protein
MTHNRPLLKRPRTPLESTKSDSIDFGLDPLEIALRDWGELDERMVLAMQRKGNRVVEWKL